MQMTRLACSLARPRTGSRMAIRIAMMAMTTSSSTSVKPLLNLPRTLTGPVIIAFDDLVAARRCIGTPDVCIPTLMWRNQVTSCGLRRSIKNKNTRPVEINFHEGIEGDDQAALLAGAGVTAPAARVARARLNP